MIHLCQAEIEMIVLAIDVLNDNMANRRLLLDRPPFSAKARHAIRGYIFQLIEEIQNVRRKTKITENFYVPTIQR